MITKTLKAEKVVLFLHNKDIDHLYSFSTTQSLSAAQTFAPDSIRMKSNLGLAGKAFTTGKIQIDNGSVMIAEEKDLNKLKIKQLKNGLAIPINGAKLTSIAVLQVYNFQEEVTAEDERIQNLAYLVSGILQSVDSLQEHFIETDIVESHFNVIQDAVIILNIHQAVIKINRAALSMIGVKSADIIMGKHVTEVISGPLNNHLFNCFKEMVESKSP